MTAYDIPRLKTALAGLKIEENPAIVKQKSRDFFWYSPVLKRQLDHITADLVVSPKSETEVIRVLAECYALGIPVTPRGSGTGNYGQAMPLSGGVVLNLAEMNKVKAISRGSVVAEAGLPESLLMTVSQPRTLLTITWRALLPHGTAP